MNTQLSGAVPWLVWLSWLECRPINRKVTSSIPGQGTCLGCGSVPSTQYTCERQPVNVSLSFSLPSCLSQTIKHILGSGLKGKKNKKNPKKPPKGQKDGKAQFHDLDPYWQSALREDCPPWAQGRTPASHRWAHGQPPSDTVSEGTSANRHDLGQLQTLTYLMSVTKKKAKGWISMGLTPLQIRRVIILVRW